MQNKYNIVFSWGLPMEHLIAVICKNAFHKYIKSITLLNLQIIKDTIEHTVNTKNNDINILLCGSYFKDTDLPQLQTELKDDGFNVHFNAVVYSDNELNVYGNVPHVKYQDFFTDQSEKILWMTHIIRRNNPESKPIDDVFYRGFCLYCNAENINHGQGFKDLIAKKIKINSIMDSGKTIIVNCKYNSHHAVEQSAAQLKCGGYNATIVNGAWNTVMPFVTAAANVQNSDIGINVRYNFKTKKTHMTFYTFDPDNVDLNFVTLEPFNGGGKRHCKGCTINGLIMIDPYMSSLEECFNK